MANLEQCKEIIVDLLVEIGRYKEFEGRSEKLDRELAMEKQKNADLNNLVTRNKVEHQQSLMSSIGTANGFKVLNKALTAEIKACEEAYDAMESSLLEEIKYEQSMSFALQVYLDRIDVLQKKNEDLVEDVRHIDHLFSENSIKREELGLENLAKAMEIANLKETIDELRSVNPTKQNDKL
tara:strand:+ start:1083 stop:1625 length:543 start_codon:yes stop_codon:yes gene_type:complete